MHLYDLTEALEQFRAHLEDKDTPDDDDLASLYALEGKFDAKVEGIAKVIKGIEADIPGLEQEIERLSRRRNAAKGKAAWMKRQLHLRMFAAGCKKVKGEVLTVTLAKSPPSCTVTDPEAVPEEFREREVTWKVDRKAIIARFKDTKEPVPGCTIEADNTNLRIR